MIFEKLLKFDWNCFESLKQTGCKPMLRWIDTVKCRLPFLLGLTVWSTILSSPMDTF